MNISKSIYSILIYSKKTEKSVRIADKYRQITFEVNKKSNKYDIKRSVEKIFNVSVESVRIINVKGKEKEFKKVKGRRSNCKKAIISLKKGFDINLSEFK